MFFQNIIKAIYNEHCANDPACREFFLGKFKEDNYFLIDAVEYPITACTNSERKRIILDDLPKLIEKLIEFNKKNLIDDKTKIILIKKLVCELLKNPIENNEDVIFDKSEGVSEVEFPRYFSDPFFVDIVSEFIK